MTTSSENQAVRTGPGARPRILAIVAALVAATALAVLAGLYATRSGEQPTSGQGYPGLGGDFQLQSANGPVALADYRGKAVLIYFGFTACPDVCPTALGVLAGALRQLEEGERERVQVLFVSIDPERDTPERMQQYTRYFHPDFIGLTGTPEQIADVAEAYRFFYGKVPLENSALEYTMDHSATTFVVGPDGTVHSLLHHGVAAGEVVEELRTVLAG
ncbi:SCO family protein [Thioalkalicoccus limnaeus]|uniref:SCO family protein n=1 Tax=Thioalkalicoccus limnaeus TaxID=120681 RepID=A0ABV4BI47_9GAMM